MITNEELWAEIEPRLEGLQGSGANLEARCPIHEHKTGKPFSINPIKGVWNCHGRGEGGTLYQLAQELGCLTRRSVTSDTNSCSRNKAAPAMNWGLDAAMVKYGLKVHERGVIFPVYDAGGNRCRDHVRLHEGDPRFQYWVKGRTYHALVDWPLVREWGAGCGIAYMVEGNRDWLTLAAHGWPAIGILGIDHFAAAREDALSHLRDAGIDAR